MTDSLTILTAVPGRRCAKLYEALDQKPKPYDAGFLFAVEETPVGSLAELAEALDALRAMPDRMVIRDRLRPGAQPSPNGLFARRRVDRPGDPAPFGPADHQWAMFDADSTRTPFDPATPVESVEAFRAALPAALQQAAMVFQFSASQHLHQTVRGHAWVWLKEPLGAVPLARWSSRNGLDPAVFHAVQPLYTADPLFAEGLTDPLAPRALVVLEGSDAVELDLTEEDYREGALAAAGGNAGQRVGSVHLAEVGDPSDHPEAVKARAAVAAQLAKAFDGPGKRWDLCGHVGGACANAGAPPEEACAILEALRAGDVADYEFAQGLQWALGAYSFTAKPLGVKGIKELCGPIVANKVADALRMLAEVYREPTPEEEAAALEAASKAPSPWGSLPLEDFDHESEPAPIAYICEGLQIGPGKPTGIVAYANNSKTPFALELAVYVAAPALAGKKFQGHAIERQTRVLVVVAEGARNARRKLAKICKGHGVRYADLREHLTITQGPPGFLTIEAAEELGARALEQGFGLVVIDTYNSAFDGSKDRNTNDFSQALKVLGDISDRSDITFAALLHTRKGDPKNQHRMPTLQDIDGHNSIAGALQAAVGLWRLSAEDKHTIGVCCIREVDAAFDTYTIKWTDTPAVGGPDDMGLRAELVEGDALDGLDARVAESREQAALEEDWTRQLLQLIDQTGSTTVKFAREQLNNGLGRPAKERAISRLAREGLIAVNVVGNSQQVTRCKGVKAAEAAAKHAGAGPGFLAGGAPRGKAGKGPGA